MRGHFLFQEGKKPSWLYFVNERKNDKQLCCVHHLACGTPTIVDLEVIPEGIRAVMCGCLWVRVIPPGLRNIYVTLRLPFSISNNNSLE